jgi:hypothetical protein
MLAAISASSTPATGVSVKISSGYSLFSADAYGGYVGSFIYYCKNEKNGNVYDCTNGTIGKEMVPPDGFTFAGSASWGLYLRIPTYFCREIATGQVAACYIQQ